MKKRVVITAIALLCGAMASPVRAFTHPCIPSTVQDLDAIKANLNQQPWKAGVVIRDNEQVIWDRPSIAHSA